MPKKLSDSLLRHWPDGEDVFDVVSSQAESFTTPVLLAVHQPMEFRLEDEHGKDLGEVDQQAFLERVLEDHRDGYRIVPLLGPPGVGKSHALRWLDARIRELDTDNKYHIVRVQKGASLRKVLFEVAEGLDGPAYDNFKARIEEAQEGLSRGTLLWALTGELSKELDYESPPGWVDDELREAYDEWHEGLQAFLGDHMIRERFLDNDGEGPLALLANRIHEGLKPEEVNQEETRHKFLSADFEDAFHGFGTEITNLSVPAKNFLFQLDGHSREQCAALLNGALDPATSRLLNFRGGELFELFVEVRRQLFREGKEWVLLLEDLTALAGIRGDLFNIIVRGKDDQDVERGGELCTIRSVLAATPGHISGFRGPWGTLVSRAETLYNMQEIHPDSDAQIARVVELVGAYLNAARIGSRRLTEAFANRTPNEPWVPNFSAEEKDTSVVDTLDTFGKSEGGFHLFPLNRAAIRQRLLSQHRTLDGDITYNPRSIIGKLVRNTLFNMRDQFIRGEFPPALFGTDKLTSEPFILELGRRIPEATDLDRYLRLLRYWGNQPMNAGDAARLPGAVYEAFGLNPIDFGVVPPETETEPETTPDTTPRPSVNRWRDVLTRWRTGEAKLIQKDARDIREAVSDAVLRGMPGGWPGLPYPGRRVRIHIRNKKTFIPRAGTGEASEKTAAIVVCTEKDLRDEKRGAEVVLDLLAVLETHSAKDPWSYEDRTEGATFRRYCAFVSRHQERAAQWLRAEQTVVTSGDSSAPLLEGLLLSAALLGSWEGDESAVSDRIANLVRPAKAEIRGHGEWAELLEAAKDFHTAAQDAFSNSFCSYQGSTGKTPLAVDVSELLESIEAVDVGKVRAPRKDTPLRNEIQELRSNLSDGVKKREARLADWSNAAKDFLDQTFHQHLRKLSALAEARNSNVDSEGQDLSQSILRSLERLPETLGAIVQSLANLRSTPMGSTKIALMSSIDEETLRAVDDLSKAVVGLLAVAAPKAKQQLTMLQGEDNQASIAELEETVEGIERALDY